MCKGVINDPASLSMMSYCRMGWRALNNWDNILVQDLALHVSMGGT